MLTNIRSRKFELTDEMKAYIEKRMAKYDRMLGGLEEINVLVSEQRNIKKVEVTIPLHDVILRCEETDADFYACVDNVAEKLGGPVRKHKTRLAKKMKEGSNNKRVIAAMPDNVKEAQLVRCKKFTAKPYSVDEAIMQMDLLGHNFFAFVNEETEQINVVYLRHDGNYGLLEPEA
ncbi:MAG: ribosome hibernation-promoting factor, HPF/YfiA family [Bacillota bacterium]|jgi:putative sigma-54 modulation protein